MAQVAQPTADQQVAFGFASADNPRSRWHVIDRPSHFRSWRCVPIHDVVDMRNQLLQSNDKLRAAVAEGDRRIEVLRESIHPTIDGYCRECGGSCLIGVFAATPARDAIR